VVFTSTWLDTFRMVPAPASRGKAFASIETAREVSKDACSLALCPAQNPPASWRSIRIRAGVAGSSFNAEPALKCEPLQRRQSRRPELGPPTAGLRASECPRLPWSRIS